MSLSFSPLHPTFVAEVSAVALEDLHDPAVLAEIRAGMDRHAVLVFREQAFSDASQLAFATRLDGELHAKTGSRAVYQSRLATEAIADISNVNHDDRLFDRDDRKRLYGLANRLWHTDASFVDPPGRYSMLHARILPPVAADTEFADTRSAYDALDAATRDRLEGLRVHHSIAYSRQTLGFEFSGDEADMLKGAVQPLVRVLPRSGRRALYLASHASTILDWPVPEARLLLRDLMEHATQRQFVYRHAWQPGDLVIWDNRATMHRATPFEDDRYRRELRRVTTLDIGEGLPAAFAPAANAALSVG